MCAWIWIPFPCIVTMKWIHYILISYMFYTHQCYSFIIYHFLEPSLPPSPPQQLKMEIRSIKNGFCCIELRNARYVCDVMLAIPIHIHISISSFVASAIRFTVSHQITIRNTTCYRHLFVCVFCVLLYILNTLLLRVFIRNVLIRME